MTAKTAMKSTRKGVETKLAIVLTADVIDHALAFECTWRQPAKQPGSFVAPVWARTKVATIRGLQPVIAEHGMRFFTTSAWRDHLSQEEARACLAIARRLRQQFFAEFAGD